MGAKKAGNTGRPPHLIGIRMSTAERERYVRWWIDHSGLGSDELRAIATGVWADRVFDERSNSKSQAA